MAQPPKRSEAVQSNGVPHIWPVLPEVGLAREIVEAPSRRPTPAPCILDPMASKAQTPAAPQTQGFAYSALLLGWLIPGAGHLLTRHWIRALLLFLAITAMFSLGLAMRAKVYAPNTGDPLDMLGFAGDLGTGLLYFIARIFSLGASTVQLVTADYGTKFVVVAGLLNFVAAVDAHNLRIGRKL